MQHRPFSLQHQRRPAAEWETPFAPVAVRWTWTRMGATERGHTRAGATTTLPAGVPGVRLAALYRTLGLRDDPLPLSSATGVAVADAALVPAIAEQADALAAWMTAPEAGGSAGSLAIVTGAARSGRTTLLHAATRTAPAPQDVIRIADLAAHADALTDSRFLQEIVRAFGAEPVGRAGLDLVRQIRNLAAGADGHPILAIDGADLAGSRLDLLRALLTPLDGTSGARLRIVVTGTPEFRDRVLRRVALADRLGLDLRIAALDETALAAFIGQRLAAVALDEPDQVMEGAAPRPPRAAFTPEAVAIVQAWSGGIIGPAIELAGECLLEAIARGTQAVDRGIAHDVAREFTDRARDAARQRDASPFIAPAVQAQLALPFAGAPASTGQPTEARAEASRATTRGRKGGR